MKLKVNSKEILNVLSCLVSLIFAILFEKLRAQTKGGGGGAGGEFEKQTLHYVSLGRHFI